MDEAQIRSRVGSLAGRKLRLRKSVLNDWSWGVGFRTRDLVQESKHRFRLVVRLIANECYEDTFYFLSFLPTMLRLPSLALHTRLISLHRIIQVPCYPAGLCLDLKSGRRRPGNFCCHYSVAVEQVKAEGIPERPSLGDSNNWCRAKPQTSSVRSGPVSTRSSFGRLSRIEEVEPRKVIPHQGDRALEG